MRSSVVRVWFGAWAAAAAIAACGTGVNVGSSASGSGAGGQGSASSGGGTSATGMGGAASSVTSSSTGGPDASTDAGDASFTPSNFDCQGCLCDGATHYCLVIHGGAPIGQAPKGPPPEPTCDDDASPNDCKPLPAACGGKPSCACLDMGGACQCEEMGGGVTVTCLLP